MDKNYKQKAKDFFRKEGFYVVLFICLCIITTVATIAIKKAKDSESQAKIEENNNKEISLNVDDKSVNNEIQNAQRVENTQSQSESVTKEVVANNEVKFTNPIEGNLVREYTYPKPVKLSETYQRNIKGIDVNAAVGTDVKVAAEGVVESVGKGNVDEGVTIVIKHANGIKTKYCYLDSNLVVKQGDKVTAGSVIGKVGKIPVIFGVDEAEGRLNLQVINAKDDQVDPLKYFSYKIKK